MIVVYFARYHKSNLAGNDKVQSILQALQLVSQNCHIVTTAALFLNTQTSWMKMLSPFALFFDIALATLNGIGACLNSFSFGKKKHILVVSYNLLPDTSLPAIILYYVFKAIPVFSPRLMLQVEEDIQRDAVSVVWKSFSCILKRLCSYDLVLSVTKSASEGIFSRSPHLIYPGVFRSSDIRIPFENTFHETPELRLIFSARIDNQRGTFLFLKALSELDTATLQYLSSMKVRIFVAGYGSKANILKAKSILSRLISQEFYCQLLFDYIDCSEDEFQSIYYESNILLSIMESPSFADKSFPSKIFKAFCEKKIVISFGSIDFSAFPYFDLLTFQEFSFSKLVSAIGLISGDFNKYMQCAHQLSCYVKQNYSSVRLSKQIHQTLDL